MNRDYIIHAVEHRLKELEKLYRDTVKSVGATGVDLSYGSSRVIRCNTKKDIQMCCLVYQSALHMDKSAEIVDDDAVAGLLRLIEPKKRGR